jgi:hypothetical protein
LARVLKTIVQDCIEYQTDGRLPYMVCFESWILYKSTVLA